MSKGKESLFQKRVLSDLRKLPKTFAFTKEALSIRGLPDVLAVVNGRFIALELKKDLASTRVTTGRIVLQKYTLDKIRKAGGYAVITCPELWEQHLADLIAQTKTSHDN